MKHKKVLNVFSSVMALSLILTGCSTSKTKESKTSPKVEFATSVENSGEVKKDAILKYGILSADPFTGLYNPVFYLNSEDGDVISIMTGATFSVDNSFIMKQDNEDDPVKYHLDKDKKEVTLTIHKDLKWNNGEDVTSKDIIATYLLMGNGKYVENVRYSDAYERIEGMAEYHAGKASDISGIKEVDNRTVVIKLKELHPAIQFGDGLLYAFLNHKQVEEVKDFTKFAEYDLNRKPLTYGPYYIEKEVVGESVLFKPNPHFYKKDKVKVKGIEVKRITPAQASASMKSGDVDIMDVNPNIWNQTKDYKNGNLLGQTARDLSYVGFKLGKWDKEKGEVVVDPNSKLADKNLRLAMGYAIDRDQINDKIYKGLRFTATGSGMYPPSVGDLANPKAEKFTKDVEKAKKLLDEAGYKDKDGDGLREDKNGNKLVINFSKIDGGLDYDQTLADLYLKSWKDIGLDVQLTDGKMLAYKDFSQRVQADDPKIDVFLAGWTFGTLSNREEFIGRKSTLNWYRFASDTLDKDMMEQKSSAMFEKSKLIEAYNRFDNDMANEFFQIPISWGTSITWINKRIKHYDLKKLQTGEDMFYEVELVSDAPIKE